MVIFMLLLPYFWTSTAQKIWNIEKRKKKIFSLMLSKKDFWIIQIKLWYPNLNPLKRE